MTVKDLFELCKEEIENGNGDRSIVLCVNEDEFYPLESRFSSPVYNDSAIYDLLEEWEEDEDNVIVLNQQIKQWIHGRRVDLNGKEVFGHTV